MVGISFTNPVYLWFLFTLPILFMSHSIVFNNTKNKALKFANFEAISRITGTQFIKKNVFLLFFRLVILTLIVLSVSGITITYLGKTTDTNYVLAIDSSASMLAQDIEPNRLEAGKQTILKFLDFIPKRTKIGLVPFSGVALVQSIITDDFLTLKNKISKIEVSNIGGTAMGNAIITSVNMILSEKDQRSKVLILITDGQNNIGMSIEEAIAYANKNNIIINTIGVGTEEGGRFIGSDILSKLDEESLKFIAQQTNGVYFRAETGEKLLDSFKEISKLNKKKISVNLSFSFIFLALILLLIEWAMINTKNKIIP